MENLSFFRKLAFLLTIVGALAQVTLKASQTESDLESSQNELFFSFLEEPEEKKPIEPVIDEPLKKQVFEQYGPKLEMLKERLAKKDREKEEEIRRAILEEKSKEKFEIPVEFRKAIKIESVGNDKLLPEYLHVTSRTPNSFFKKSNRYDQRGFTAQRSAFKSSYDDFLLEQKILPYDIMIMEVNPNKLKKILYFISKIDILKNNIHHIALKKYDNNKFKNKYPDIIIYLADTTPLREQNNIKRMLASSLSDFGMLSSIKVDDNIVAAHEVVRPFESAQKKYQYNYFQALKKIKDQSFYSSAKFPEILPGISLYQESRTKPSESQSQIGNLNLGADLD